MDYTIEFDAPERGPDGLAVFRPGDTVAGRAMLLPDRDADVRGVQLWIGCQIHGSGTPETVEVQPEYFLHQGALQAGVPVEGTFSVALPDHAPLSYQGRRVKFDWLVRLRVDVPFWRDKRLEQPFVVAPRAA